MRVVEDIRQNIETFPRVVLTVGSFDGVHRGHQTVLRELVAAARKMGGTAAVLTPRPHPREFFAPQHAPNLLTSERKKMQLIEACGVDVLFILPFDEHVAQMDRRDFLEQIVVQRCHAHELVVGHDFCFGKDALGDCHYLIEAGPPLGLKVSQVPPFIIDGERVSSTVIRERLLEGDLDEAEAFLGRKYSIVGEVVHGRGIGITLGFPTANIKPHHTAVPAQGVYIAQAQIGNHTYPAAVNIGIAPTIQHEDTVIEAFLLEFAEEIRGTEIELIFHKRLRPEKKFGSHEELIAAIARDVETVTDYFRGAM